MCAMLLLTGALFLAGSLEISRAAGAAPGQSPLEAGVAVVDITPPVGYRLCGYFNERLATGVRDPLRAKALVMRQGDCSVAWVFCDLIGLTVDVTQGVRTAVQEQLGIPGDHVLVAATHSHTGPLYAGGMRMILHRRAVAKHGSDSCEKIDYPAVLTGKLVDAVRQAHAALAPMQLQAGIGKEQGLSFNRRFHMKDGSVVFNPGKLNPNIVRVAGPIDPDVGLVLLRRPADARVLASLTVFALHLDTLGGTEYSADYPYYLEASLRKDLGPQFVSIFGNGTCGDINHINFASAAAQPQGGAETRRIGEALAARVSGELPRLKTVGSPRLAVRSQTVPARIQHYSAEEIAWAEAAAEKIGTSELSFLDQVKAYKIIDLQLRRGDTLPLQVQAFRLSDDVALVGLPGEVFVELGLAIKRQSPFAVTLVVELANDAPDYVPTEKAFREGSYETVNSRIKPGGGEAMAAAAVQLLAQLKPGR